MGKARIDVTLVARGLAESRTRAQALILAGLVYVGTRVAKAGEMLAEDAEMKSRAATIPGCRAAESSWPMGSSISAWTRGAVAMDVGFDRRLYRVLLTRGAARSMRSMSGTNQLAWKLRQDPRVMVLEQTNARDADRRAIIPEPVDIDRLRRQLHRRWPRCSTCRSIFARPGRQAGGADQAAVRGGRGEVGKGGVVRDPAVHTRVCDEVAEWLEAQRAGGCWASTTSPITGPEGNVEFLIAAERG